LTVFGAPDLGITVLAHEYIDRSTTARFLADPDHDVRRVVAATDRIPELSRGYGVKRLGSWLPIFGLASRDPSHSDKPITYHRKPKRSRDVPKDCGRGLHHLTHALIGLMGTLEVMA
jgi:hypothetical protein